MNPAEQRYFLGPTGSSLPLPKPDHPVLYRVTLHDPTNPRVWLRPTAEEHAIKYQPGHQRHILFSTDNINNNEFLYVTSIDNPVINGWVKAKYVLGLPESSLPGAGAAASESAYVDRSDEFWKAAKTDQKFSKFNIDKIKEVYNSHLTPGQKQDKDEFDFFISSIGPKFPNFQGGSRSRKYKNKISKKRSRAAHKRRRNNRSKTSRNVRRRVR